MTFLINNNTTYNYSYYATRPKWLIETFVKGSVSSRKSDKDKEKSKPPMLKSNYLYLKSEPVYKIAFARSRSLGDKHYQKLKGQKGFYNTKKVSFTESLLTSSQKSSQTSSQTSFTCSEALIFSPLGLWFSRQAGLKRKGQVKNQHAAFTLKNKIKKKRAPFNFKLPSTSFKTKVFTKHLRESKLPSTCFKTKDNTGLSKAGLYWPKGRVKTKERFLGPFKSVFTKYQVKSKAGLYRSQSRSPWYLVKTFYWSLPRRCLVKPFYWPKGLLYLYRPALVLKQVPLVLGKDRFKGDGEIEIENQGVVPRKVKSEAIYLKRAKTNPTDRHLFQTKELLCWTSDLSFFNLRGYFSNILKVLQICRFAVRNNKKILFVKENCSSNGQGKLLNPWLIQYERNTVPQKLSSLFNESNLNPTKLLLSPQVFSFKRYKGKNQKIKSLHLKCLKREMLAVNNSLSEQKIPKANTTDFTKHLCPWSLPSTSGVKTKLPSTCFKTKDQYRPANLKLPSTSFKTKDYKRYYQLSGLLNWCQNPNFKEADRYNISHFKSSLGPRELTVKLNPEGIYEYIQNSCTRPSAKSERVKTKVSKGSLQKPLPLCPLSLPHKYWSLPAGKKPNTRVEVKVPLDHVHSKVDLDSKETQNLVFTPIKRLGKDQAPGLYQEAGAYTKTKESPLDPFVRTVSFESLPAGKKPKGGTTAKEQELIKPLGFKSLNNKSQKQNLKNNKRYLRPPKKVKVKISNIIKLWVREAQTVSQQTAAGLTIPLAGFLTNSKTTFNTVCNLSNYDFYTSANSNFKPNRLFNRGVCKIKTNRLEKVNFQKNDFSPLPSQSQRHPSLKAFKEGGPFIQKDTRLLSKLPSTCFKTKAGLYWYLVKTDLKGEAKRLQTSILNQRAAVLTTTEVKSNGGLHTRYSIKSPTSFQINQHKKAKEQVKKKRVLALNFPSFFESSKLTTGTRIKGKSKQFIKCNNSTFEFYQRPKKIGLEQKGWWIDYSNDHFYLPLTPLWSDCFLPKVPRDTKSIVGPLQFNNEPTTYNEKVKKQTLLEYCFFGDIFTWQSKSQNSSSIFNSNNPLNKNKDSAISYLKKQILLEKRGAILFKREKKAPFFKHFKRQLKIFKNLKFQLKEPYQHRLKTRGQKKDYFLKKKQLLSTLGKFIVFYLKNLNPLTNETKQIKKDQTYIELPPLPTIKTKVKIALGLKKSYPYDYRATYGYNFAFNPGIIFNQLDKNKRSFLPPESTFSKRQKGSKGAKERVLGKQQKYFFDQSLVLKQVLGNLNGLLRYSVKRQKGDNAQRDQKDKNVLKNNVLINKLNALPTAFLPFASFGVRTKENSRSPLVLNLQDKDPLNFLDKNQKRKKKQRSKSPLFYKYYKTIVALNNFNQCKTFAKSPFVSNQLADIIFFINPEKNQNLVNQANSLKIPTVGIITGNAANSQGHQGDNCFRLKDSVYYPIIGNPMSSFFTRAIISLIVKCLRVEKSKNKANLK